MSSDYPESGTVHWQHPRWDGEEPLFRVEPDAALNEYYIAKKLGPTHVGVRGRWWYVETENGVETRTEVIGYKTPIPEWVRDALLDYENDNYGPIEEVLNPVDDDRHGPPADPELDKQQQEIVTDGGKPDGEMNYRRYDGDRDDWSYGDPTVGFNVPISVRSGGATRPMEREEIGENGVALSGHSAAYDCENCGHTQWFATSEYVTQYNCRGCGEITWFRLQGCEDAE